MCFYEITISDVLRDLGSLLFKELALIGSLISLSVIPPYILIMCIILVLKFIGLHFFIISYATFEVK